MLSSEWWQTVECMFVFWPRAVRRQNYICSPKDLYKYILTPSLDGYLVLSGSVS